MRSSIRRRPNGSSRGLRRRVSKWTWLALFGVGAVAILWIVGMVSLVPGKIAEEVENAFAEAKEDKEDKVVTPGSRDLDQQNNVFTRSNEVKIRTGPREQPVTMEKIVSNMRSFLDELHEDYANRAKAPPDAIWMLYKEAADKWLLPMDRDNQGYNLFDVRDDNSIFVSLASYRDENCPATLVEMFSKADRPDYLFVGLVQQNCVSGCKTGVLEGGVVNDVEPDIDCYDTFCDTDIGAPYCDNSQVRNFFVNEAESLGPAVARYFASKLWQGETYFLQIDAHSLFRKGWDTVYVNDIQATPSYPRSVLSHYPPDTKVAQYWEQPGYRICGGIFASSPVEYEIIRLTAGIPQDRGIPEKPCPAPFVGAGFFFAHSTFLATVPFDPYVPWVFMGEEILLSLRFWTWGYDIYSPTKNVLSHMYVRRHTPKFWETVNRLFKNPSTHNDLTRMIIHRVKYIAGYPESSAEILSTTVPSLMANLDLYGDGPVRAMEDYMALVGLDMSTKRGKKIDWCFKCQEPYPV